MSGPTATSAPTRPSWAFSKSWARVCAISCKRHSCSWKSSMALKLEVVGDGHRFQVSMWGPCLPGGFLFVLVWYHFMSSFPPDVQSGRPVSPSGTTPNTEPSLATHIVGGLISTLNPLFYVTLVIAPLCSYPDAVETVAATSQCYLKHQMRSWMRHCFEIIMRVMLMYALFKKSPMEKFLNKTQKHNSFKCF